MALPGPALSKEDLERDGRLLRILAKLSISTGFISVGAETGRVRVLRALLPPVLSMPASVTFEVEEETAPWQPAFDDNFPVSCVFCF